MNVPMRQLRITIKARYVLTLRLTVTTRDIYLITLRHPFSRPNNSILGFWSGKDDYQARTLPQKMLFMHLMSQPASLLWRYWRPRRRGIHIDTYIHLHVPWFLFLVHVCFFRSIVEFATWKLSGPAAKTSTAMLLRSPSKMRSHPKLVSVATPKFSRWKRSLPRLV